MVEFHHQWQFLYQRCNWYDFTFVKLDFEHDPVFGNVEASVWFLGIGLRFSWHYKDTSKGRDLAARLAEIDTP